MIERFENDESNYLQWIQANPNGYVVNVDKPQYFPQYPMVHVASHKLVSSPARTNYTTGRYLKFCSDNLEALEQWSQDNYRRPLTHCSNCMKSTRPAYEPILERDSKLQSMSRYNPKNCQSLFGYAAAVHVRSGGECQLCGCGSPLDFDMWRQMTVEHLIGKSQGGYLKQIHAAVASRFLELTPLAHEELAKRIDILNTVTACSFCNSTTSRDVGPKTMPELLNEAQGSIEEVVAYIDFELKRILTRKRNDVQWKLSSVRHAFKSEVCEKISSPSTGHASS